VSTPPNFLCPYVTPAILQQAPTGISWNTIPSGSQTTPQQKTAEIWSICQRATSMAEGYTNQQLRCTLNTEFVQGPDYYATYQQATGNMRIIMSRWPVTGIESVQVSPNCFPRSWTTLTAGYYAPEWPVIGTYGSTAPGGSGQGGQAIILSSLAGGGWWLGRNGYIFQVQYYSGWPHTQLTATAAAGATTVSVDDCTGWALSDEAGTTATTRGGVYDQGGQDEGVSVTAASATTGPGTLTLSAGLTYSHDPYTMVSALPQTIQWACVLFAAGIALTRGATATSIHTIPGGASGTPAMKGPESLMEEAELLLHSYRRVI
jgi:hypothetical protein